MKLRVSDPASRGGLDKGPSEPKARPLSAPSRPSPRLKKAIPAFRGAGADLLPGWTGESGFTLAGPAGTAREPAFDYLDQNTLSMNTRVVSPLAVLPERS